MRDADFLKTLSFRGRVFSGKGLGSKFVSLSWAKKQMEEELGFCLFPGTLDVRLAEDSVSLKTDLLKAVGVAIHPAPGHCRARLFKATLNSEVCAVIVPEVHGYPQDVIEIVAEANLREKLGLIDDSFVQVEVTF